MGTSDLKATHSPGAIDRRVTHIYVHPKYTTGKAYYDVGIAKVHKLIEFNEYVRPVCLPYLPVDDASHLEDQFVTLGGWGYANQTRTGVELTPNLRLRSLRVKPAALCVPIHYLGVKRYKY